ncbi:CST complex subunit STN1 [Dissophora ornata]|nr:CST complex subunit STN1 [Dissophora ornata]
MFTIHRAGIYRHHSHPVRAVEIMGVVQMVHRANKRILYNLDDGTGAIQCIMWIPDEYLALQNTSRIPGLEAHELGDVIRVVGQPSDFKGCIQITFGPGDSAVCTDPNDETNFRLRVLSQEKFVYSKPVVLPDIVLQEAQKQERGQSEVTQVMLLDHLREWARSRKEAEFDYIDMVDDEESKQLACKVIQAETRSIVPVPGEESARKLMVECLRQLELEGVVECKSLSEMVFRVVKTPVDVNRAEWVDGLIVLDDSEDDDA